MNNAELSRQLQVITELFKKTATLSDIEMQAHWAKYLCVIVAGFLENSVTELFSRYVEGQASANVTRFSHGRLEKILNPKAERFVQTAHAFNKHWGATVESFIEGDGRKEAINAIMDNRHKIAHGQTSTITAVRLQGYLDKAVEVIRFIEQTCV